MNYCKKDLLQFMVGGLLYMPAFQKNIIQKINDNAIECLTSIAFCLEDSIIDEALEEAEISLQNILSDLQTLHKNNKKLPLIFVRIRSPQHLLSVREKLADLNDLITGFILPKFDVNNAENYAAIIYDINRDKNKTVYVMPILETEMIADINNRRQNLIKIKKVLDVIEDYVLNIRVGVNDLSNIYGIRCDIRHTIYDIGIIRDVLIDILNIFSKDYVVAGPVCNFFGENSQSFVKELELDKINGFIGKTSIHPSQLKFIFDNLKVSKNDFEDAMQILNWSSNSHGVAKNNFRMNELKCHMKWAEKIKILSDIYGVKDDL